MGGRVCVVSGEFNFFVILSKAKNLLRQDGGDLQGEEDASLRSA
jgi:hypothetical protein